MEILKDHVEVRSAGTGLNRFLGGGTSRPRGGMLILAGKFAEYSVNLDLIWCLCVVHLVTCIFLLVSVLHLVTV